MPRKIPFRPRADNGITQCLDDGIVIISTVSDTARPGYQPVEQLTPRLKLRYAEWQLGIQRYYSGRQNQIQIERVIRVPRVKGVTNQDAATTEDGTTYRIDLVQSVEGVYPPCMDLTLARYEQTAGGGGA